MKSIAFPLMLFALTMTRCATVPATTDSVRTFTIGPLPEDHEGKPNYYWGFLAEDASDKLPTQLFVWLTNNPMPGKTAVYSRNESATVYGRPFEFPTQEGAGLFTITESGKASRIPVDSNGLESIDNLTDASGAIDLDEVRELIARNSLRSELTQFTN